MRIPLGVIFLTTALAVSGCGSTGLRELQSPSTGPDEFLVMPAEPLTPPENYASPEHELAHLEWTRSGV